MKRTFNNQHYNALMSNVIFTVHHMPNMNVIQSI